MTVKDNSHEYPTHYFKGAVSGTSKFHAFAEVRLESSEYGEYLEADKKERERVANECFDLIVQIYDGSIDKIKSAVEKFSTQWVNDLVKYRREQINKGLNPENIVTIERSRLIIYAADIFKDIENATYPMMAVKPSHFRAGRRRELFDPSKDVRSDSYFGIDITRPRQFKPYLLHGIETICHPPAYAVEEHLQAKDMDFEWGGQVPIYVGHSETPIPLRFVDFEHNQSPEDCVRRKLEQRVNELSFSDINSNTDAVKLMLNKLVKSFSNDLLNVFPSPNLINIDDRIIDGEFRQGSFKHKVYRFLPSTVGAALQDKERAFDTKCKAARNKEEKWNEDNKGQEKKEQYNEEKFREIEKPLAPFRALRVDYSCVRLRHYTGCDAEVFQPYILFTNYPFYVKAFFEQALTDYVARLDGDPNAESKISWKLVIPNKDRHRRPVEFRRSHEKERDNETGEVRHKVLIVEPGEKPGDEPVEMHLSLKEVVKTWKDKTTAAPTQMPAYHLTPVWESDQNRDLSNESRDVWGVSLINIGVGPTNAKTMTDLVAALRPRAWLMLGHCGGLRMTQELGQFILAQAYVRDDHCLDRNVPPFVPIPQVIEVEECLSRAVEDIILECDPEAAAYKLVKKKREELRSSLAQMGLQIADLSRIKFVGHDPQNAGFLSDATEQDERDIQIFREWETFFKRRLRTGTIITTDDRNWELRPYDEIISWIEKSRAIAVDMESATIAANGLRYRIPYGTLLCVSDKPLYGEGKHAGKADEFYETSTANHIRIGLRAVQLLHERRDELLKSRKLNGLDDPPFR